MTERELKAFKTVKTYMWWSMGAGLVPLPFLDLAAVSGVQLKMIADLSKLYEVPFRKNSGKAAITSLAGFILPHATACGFLASLFKAVPAVGFVVGGSSMSAFSGAVTWALGNVFIQHFESGGTFLNFDPEAVKQYFKTQFEEGKKAATTIDAPEKAQVAV